MSVLVLCVFFFSSRRRHTRCALVTGVQTCALPIFEARARPFRESRSGAEGARRRVPCVRGCAARRRNRAFGRSLCRWSVCRHHREHPGQGLCGRDEALRSEEHTSELQSLMRISYAVFCLKKKKTTKIETATT